MTRKLPPAACAAPSAECHFEGPLRADYPGAGAPDTGIAVLAVAAANELARAAFAQLARLSHRWSRSKCWRALPQPGRDADAIQAWKAALELAPGDPRLERELLTSVYTNRDYVAAEKMARELIAKDPEIAELHFILGDSLMIQQQPEQAVDSLRKAVSLRPDYPAAHAVLGRALMQVGRSTEAIPHLVAALPADSDGSLHFQLSRAYQDAGQAEKAVAAMKVYQAMQKSAAEAAIRMARSATSPQPLRFSLL